MEFLADFAGTIAQFLRDQEYTEKRLSRLGLTGLPWNSLARRLAWIESCDAPLEFLIRAFYLGEAVSAVWAEKRLPKEILLDFLTSGLLRRDGEQFEATCMLTHFGELIIACDSHRRTEKSVPSDLVLGVNQTTRLLARCGIFRPGSKVLDLGAGCGPLSLTASAGAFSVLGTDINRRALDFAEFNAALNGTSNVSFRLGDRFGPVAEERFDLIISNPPFFLVPVSGLTFCDNSLDLDAFVESLARSAPHFLSKEGIFQMLCEWVEFEDQPWEERVMPWFQNSECDVHIWKGYEFSSAEYARTRALEQGQLYPETATAAFSERIARLTERRVKSIFGGLVTMRRRSGTNWFRVEEMHKKPEGPIGEALMDRFSTLDVLESNDDQLLLSVCPRLPAKVCLVNEAVQMDSSWTVEASYLERRDDLPAKMGLDGVIAQLAAGLDGTQTLETLLKRLAVEYNVPLKTARAEGVRVIKRLGAAGLVLLSLDRSKILRDL